MGGGVMKMHKESQFSFTSKEINALLLALNSFYNQKMHESGITDKSVSHAVSAGKKLKLIARLRKQAEIYL